MAQSTPPPPPPQQPPWQPPLPPQQPPWPPPKPRNNNRPLIIALAIGVPVLLVIVLVAAVASSSGDDSDDPHSVAEQFVDGINSGDADGAEAALCADAVVWPLTLLEIVDSEPDVRLTDQVEGHHDPIAGGGAMGHVDGTAAAGPHPGGMGGTLFLDQPDEGGPWCISEVRMGYADI